MAIGRRVLQGVKEIEKKGGNKSTGLRETRRRLMLP